MSKRDGLREALVRALPQIFHDRKGDINSACYEDCPHCALEAALAAPAPEQASPTVREQLNQMFGKDKVDYAIAEAAQPATEKQREVSIPFGEPIPAIINGEPGRVAFFSDEAAKAHGFKLEHRADSQETSAPHAPEQAKPFDARAFVQEHNYIEGEWVGTGVQVSEMAAEEADVRLAAKAHAAGAASGAQLVSKQLVLDWLTGYAGPQELEFQEQFLNMLEERIKSEGQLSENASMNKFVKFVALLRSGAQKGTQP